MRPAPPIAPTPTVVIKAGGSLLAEPGSIDRLRDWLANASVWPEPTKRVLLVGGGEAVEALRRIDRSNPLPTAVSHRAAIDAMDTNARLLAGWLPRLRLTPSVGPILANPAPGDWVLAPGEWLRRQEPSEPGPPLGVGWRVTSDSIAARLAARLGAGLLLIKRAPPTPYGSPTDWARAAEAGYVDRDFPAHARGTKGLNAVVLPAP